MTFCNIFWRNMLSRLNTLLHGVLQCLYIQTEFTMLCLTVNTDGTWLCFQGILARIHKHKSFNVKSHDFSFSVNKTCLVFTIWNCSGTYSFSSILKNIAFFRKTITNMLNKRVISSQRVIYRMDHSCFFFYTGQTTQSLRLK